MAIGYDAWKKSYSGMNDEQKQKYNDTMQQQGGDALARSNEFIERYNQEQQSNKPVNNENAASNSQNGMPVEGYNSPNTTEQQNTQVTQNENKVKESTNNAQDKTTSGDFNKSVNTQVSPDLDQSKFNEAPGEISVKEGTAQQTGRPDYQANTQARLDEMKKNLDQYFAESPWMFSDRETFNRVFEYDSRDSEAQRQLLDSYWKRKQDMDVASNYTNGATIIEGMKNAKITSSQLNLIKEYNPEAYREWQQQQEDEIKLRIVNSIVPPLMEDIAAQMTNMMNSLGIQPQNALQIEEAWTGSLEKTGAYQTLQDANNTVKKIEEVNDKRVAIANRYSASTGGTVSDALAAARMSKALAPYDKMMEGLQYQYQDYSNLYSQKLATANQAAAVRQMQAQENQRVWNQRLTALGFATEALSYRTPEQQAALKLQTQAIQNEMDVLHQSKMNDLNLYNQYATTKLQNQLNAELTDLSVKDPAQLRANLNNVLGEYYSAYGDIIKRSQSEVIDDVIAYAEKNNVSVAEALRKNFIEPLQSKAEYKMATSEKYGFNKYQQQYSYSIDEEGNMVIKTTGYGQIPDELFKTRGSRQEAYGDVYDSSNTWADYIQNLSGAIKDGSYGGQCGAFCNDVLIGGDQNKIFGDSLADKIKACNIDKDEGPEVGYAVVFDLGFTSKDGENHGHVGWVSAVNGDGSIDVLESNGKSDESVHIKRYTKNEVDRMVMGYYKPSNYSTQKQTISNYATYTEDNNTPYSGVSKLTSTGAEVNAGGWITDLEDQYTKDWQNKDLMNQTLKDYGISIQEYNAQKKKYVDYQAKVSLIEDTKKMYDAVQDLLTWNQKYSSKGGGSRHSGAVDLATYDAISNGTPVKNILGVIPKYDKETANGINKYNYLKNNQLLDRYQELKKAGATFGAMQKSEWDLVGSAASNLQWLSTDAEFEDVLTEMLNHYSNILADAGVEGFYSTDI